MKKVIMGLALVLGVVTSYGAVCNWSAQGITVQKAGDDLTTYTAYLVDSSVSATDFITALGNGTASYVATTSVRSNGGVLANGLATDARTGAAFVENQQYSLYTLILNTDATYYLASGVKTFTPTAQAKLNMGFLNLSTGDYKSEKGWQPVPEPTSGLLMLIGASLLALRRKQK